MKIHLRGRFWVAFWLLGFLVVALVIVRRQTSSVVLASRLRTLQQERGVLEAGRFQALHRIQEARSRVVLIPRAESLGLRLSLDSEVVSLQVPQERR